MKIHFIAIGGSAMHNLAIALKRKGYDLTGSDDEIFEPSKTRLAKEGILPESFGWDASRIKPGIEAVVLGMHARADNPELIKAKELGLPIYSYPEFFYQQTKDKKRVVIGGSHGKTTITSMILHVLRKAKVSCDYLVGAQLEGYDCMVRISDDSEIAIIEGDEYLASALDRRPKFHLYKPHIALLTGVAWDHINVFPTFENYVDQFRIFIDCIEPDGDLVYYAGDAELRALAEAARADIEAVGYKAAPHHISAGQTFLHTETGEILLHVFGDHNLQNLAGAAEVLQRLGISKSDIYAHLSDFKGASKRMELLASRPGFSVYKDFAHAPSKLKATTEALKNQYPDRTLIACMELHTFSSLNKAFLPHYRGAMAAADRAFVYYSPDVVAHKKLEPISPAEVKSAFGSENVEVFTDSDVLLKAIRRLELRNSTVLMMSSGNFDGVDLSAFAEELNASTAKIA